MSDSDPAQFIRGYQPEGGAWAPTNSHRGRLNSWVAVGLLVVGFALGGFALVLGPAWWLMVVAVAMMVVGGILCLVTDIFTDVVLDDPHYDSEEPHTTSLRRIKRRIRHTRPTSP